MAWEAREAAGRLDIALRLERPDGLPLGIRKTLTVTRDGAAVEIGYGLSWDGTEPLAGRWATQLNLALTAGDAPGRHWGLPDRPSLGGRGRREGLQRLAMVDEWAGVELALEWTGSADIGWAPVETVSLSESGFERIYQGSALLLSWPVRLEAGAVWAASARLVFTSPQDRDFP
jgi:alpha-amylase